MSRRMKFFLVQCSGVHLVWWVWGHAILHFEGTILVFWADTCTAHVYSFGVKVTRSF